MLTYNHERTWLYIDPDEMEAVFNATWYCVVVGSDLPGVPTTPTNAVGENEVNSSQIMGSTPLTPVSPAVEVAPKFLFEQHIWSSPCSKPQDISWDNQLYRGGIGDILQIGESAQSMGILPQLLQAVLRCSLDDRIDDNQQAKCIVLSNGSMMGAILSPAESSQYIDYIKTCFQTELHLQPPITSSHFVIYSLLPLFIVIPQTVVYEQEKPQRQDEISHNAMLFVHTDTEHDDADDEDST
ncbi:hypothetical protein BJ165DRAFT_1409877 [Panaeolus papilionaceus]|nr:hypothetical protein BJ165DRAFT_1409877 [Panaeolus papilionaceus]